MIDLASGVARHDSRQCIFSLVSWESWLGDLVAPACLRTLTHIYEQHRGAIAVGARAIGGAFTGAFPIGAHDDTRANYFCSVCAS
jgi:hypothetical protein